MENLIENYIEEPPVFYGGFWRRFGALFIDSLFLLLIIYPLNWYDLTNLKSYSLYVLVGLLAVLYKPVMEYSYGATLGKMALKLKCTNDKYEKISIIEALTRNAVFLIPAITSLALNYFVFTSPAFIEASTNKEVGKVILQFPIIMWVNNLPYLFWIVDAIALGSDNRKRSLHDRWANTFVIYAP
jgi:uncharacterized RDD family membrane protein YckC